MFCRERPLNVSFATKAKASGTPKSSPSRKESSAARSSVGTLLEDGEFEVVFKTKGELGFDFERVDIEGDEPYVINGTNKRAMICY